MTTLKDYLGNDDFSSFESFDLTKIKEILNYLSVEDPIDIAHAEKLQQKALWGANLITDYLTQVVKVSNVLESKISALKNKAALEYKNTDDKKVTADLRKYAAESDPKVEEYNDLLAKAKAARVFLEKKYDLLIKTHYFFKEVCIGYKRETGTVSIDSKPNQVAKNNSW